jgi:hypothetical protein
MNVVTKNNVDSYWNERDGFIESEELKKTRPTPLVTPAPKKIKLGAICIDNFEFWRNILTGIRAGKKELERIGVEVKIAMPKFKKDADGNCTCKDCKCKNCSETAQAMSCKKDKDGNCSCEEGKCKCTDCSKHS